MPPRSASHPSPDGDSRTAAQGASPYRSITWRPEGSRKVSARPRMTRPGCRAADVAKGLCINHLTIGRLQEGIETADRTGCDPWRRLCPCRCLRSLATMRPVVAGRQHNGQRPRRHRRHRPRWPSSVQPGDHPWNSHTSSTHTPTPGMAQRTSTIAMLRRYRPKQPHVQTASKRPRFLPPSACIAAT